MPGDLGIAEMNDEVNHRRFSQKATLCNGLHGEPDEVQRLTSSLRTSGEGIWPLIRSLVETEGIRSRDEHWLGPWNWRPERTQHAEIVARDSRVSQFLDGSSPVDDPLKPPKLPYGWFEAPPRQDWGPDIELGFEMLRDGTV